MKHRPSTQQVVNFRANEQLTRPVRLIAALLAAGIASACHRPIAHLKVPNQSAVALTGGTTTSMIYVARTREGVLVIDLGWTGYRRPLRRALEELGITARDVRWVFVTHAHRDHVSARVVHASISRGRRAMTRIDSGEPTEFDTVRKAKRRASNLTPRLSCEVTQEFAVLSSP